MKNFYKKALKDRSDVEKYDTDAESHFDSILKSASYIKESDYKREPQIQNIKSKVDFAFGKIVDGKIETPDILFEVKNISVIPEDVEKFEGVVELKPQERLRKSISRAVRPPNEENDVKAGNLYEYRNLDCIKMIVVYDYLSLSRGDKLDLLESVYGVHVMQSIYNLLDNKIYSWHTLSKKDTYVLDGMFNENINTDIAGVIYVGVPKQTKYIKIADPSQLEITYLENIYCDKKFDIKNFLKGCPVNIISYKDDAFWNSGGDFIIHFEK